MSWVYVLKSEKRNKYYIGSTTNLSQRLKQHKAGQTRTTRILEAYRLVYQEKYANIKQAKLREKQLKSYKSHKHIDWLITKGP